MRVLGGEMSYIAREVVRGELSGGELSWGRERSVPHVEESPRSCTLRHYVHVSFYFCKTTSLQSPSLRRSKQVYFLLFHLLWRQSKRSVFWCKFHSNVVYFTNKKYKTFLRGIFVHRRACPTYNRRGFCPLFMS